MGDDDDRPKITIRKNDMGMIIPEGITIKPVSNIQEVHEVASIAQEQRHVASTKMNAESSRSHLIVSLLLTTKDKTTGAEITGKITLVDLAGSERLKKTGASGQQLKEANSINKSLSALSNVIAALIKEDSKHV